MRLKKINFVNNIFFTTILLLIALSSFVYSELIRGDLSTSDLPKEVTSEYFPVDSSLKLIYNSSFGEAISVIKKDGDNFILDIRNDDFFFVQTVQVKNDTVYLTNLDEEVDVFLFISAGVSVTYDRPSLRFPFPLEINDTWQWKGIEYIDGDDADTITISGKVLSNELIKTEAGDFDCIKFEIDINKNRSGTHTKFYEWRTPQIGLVKLEAYIDSKGFIGTIMDLLGYDEMYFILKKIV